MADRQAVLGSGAKFSGKITNAKSIEINFELALTLFTIVSLLIVYVINTEIESTSFV